ncbi:hypothetical protein BDV30DRAFT_233675 [Aspergillus minisclerotigenes]|uniref:Uncharacterized protein n=1 Tax=Aspergillus minisclerotigenes TaxID=656917 RepID=A0A5N6JLQ4_9EURO|nr:hypothetical protein BDV30DRAFT_233675 [Aspergillus minisclerotigenes]
MPQGRQIVDSRAWLDPITQSERPDPQELTRAHLTKLSLFWGHLTASGMVSWKFCFWLCLNGGLMVVVGIENALQNTEKRMALPNVNGIPPPSGNEEEKKCTLPRKPIYPESLRAILARLHHTATLRVAASSQMKRAVHPH